MTMLPTLSRVSLLQMLLNRTSKRLRLTVALALITTVTGAIALISSGSHFFRGSRAAGGTIENTQPALTRNSVVSATLAAPPADGQLNIARRGHTATVLSDGKVLVTGGENAAGFVTVVEVFDPTGGGFSVSGNLSTTLSSVTIVARPWLSLIVALIAFERFTRNVSIGLGHGVSAHVDCDYHRRVCRSEA